MLKLRSDNLTKTAHTALENTIEACQATIVSDDIAPVFKGLEGDLVSDACVGKFKKDLSKGGCCTKFVREYLAVQDAIAASKLAHERIQLPEPDFSSVKGLSECSAKYYTIVVAQTLIRNLKELETRQSCFKVIASMIQFESVPTKLAELVSLHAPDLVPPAPKAVPLMGLDPLDPFG